MSTNLDSIFNTGAVFLDAAHDVVNTVTRGYNDIKNNVPIDSRRNAPVNYGAQPAAPTGYERFVTEYPYAPAPTYSMGYGYTNNGSVLGNQNNGYFGFTDPTYGKIGSQPNYGSQISTPIFSNDSIFGASGGVI